MQHVLVNIQCEKTFIYSMLIFVISLFGCPLALDAQGRRPVRPSARHFIKLFPSTFFNKLVIM